MFFKNYKRVIFVVAILLAALILLSYNLKHDSRGGIFKKLVLEISSPLQNVLSASIKSVNDSWMRYVFLVGLEDENRRLNKKMAELKAELILYKEGYLEAERLRKLLALQNDSNHQFVAARVIGRGQTVLSKSIIINKGKADGLKSGMPVIAEEGLIGRLIDVSWHSSKVLLLLDENSNIDGIDQRSRALGIIRGAGSRGCMFRYVSKTQDVKEGDIIITSGMSNAFPKGLLIGTVSHVDRQDPGLFLRINVAPFTDFSKLEEVMVLVTEVKEEEDENE
jgi:rod shape-determining protein MreC